jgi:hypothetical protein
MTWTARGLLAVPILMAAGLLHDLGWRIRGGMFE